MTEPIQAILFDVGGTLRRGIDRAFPEKVELCKPILELTRQKTDPEEFTRLLDERAKAYRKWTRQEMLELDETRFWTTWMLPELPPGLIEPMAVELNQIWRNADRQYHLLPDAGETILGLFRAGYRLGLVSNTTSSTEAPTVLNELGVSGCFEAVVLSCDLGIRKPRPEILLDAVRRMGVRAEQCAYVGNLPDRDVASARSAGFGQTVILKDPEKPIVLSEDPALHPDHLIDHLIELLAIFPARPRVGRKASHAPRYAISLSTMWGVKKFTEFRDFFLAAPRLGFTGIELNHQVRTEMLKGIDLTHHNITSVHEPCPAIIPADVLKKQDLLISSTDEGRRLQGIAAVKQSIDLAGELGGRTVVVHCGQLPGEWAMEKELRALFEIGKKDTDTYREIKQSYIERRASQVAPHLECVRKSLLELLEYAARVKVRLGIENRYYHYDIPTLDEMDPILDLADPDRIGFIYDIGHAQTQDRLGFSSNEAWLKRYGDRIIGTHLHDVIGIRDHKAPGLGEVDFRMVAGYLPKTACRTLEVAGSNSPEQIKKGLEILVDAGCVDLHH